MNRPPQQDANLERRLQRHYERAFGPEPDLEQLWTGLAPQLGGHEARSGPQLLESRPPRTAAPVPLPRQAPRRSRPIVTALIGLAAVLVITLLTTAVLISREGNNQAQKPSWSLYFTNASTLQTDAVDPNGHLLWRYQSSTYRTLPLLTLANGVIYSATYDGQIVAVKGADGSVLWSKEISPNTAQSLRVVQVADGVVYASADIGRYATSPDERDIYALDAKTGKLLWTFRQADKVAALADGVLYVYGLPSKGYAPFVQVFALNARDGTIRWQKEVAGTVVGATPLEDGQLYIAASGGTSQDTSTTLYALQASNGAERWHATQHGQLAIRALLAAQGLVYLMEFDANLSSAPGSLIALDATSGQQRWQRGGLTGSAVPPLPSAGPFYQNGVIYATGSDQGVYALRAGDGTPLWHRPQDSGQEAQLLTVDDNTLYLLQYTSVNEQLPSNNRLVALNLSDGSRRWQYDVPGPVQAVSLHGGVIYGCWSSQSPGKRVPQGQAFALNTNDGSLRWTYDDNKLAFAWLVAG